MDYTIAAGAISLGMVVGWMVYRTFIQQATLDVKFLSSLISVMVGAGVIGIFQKISGSSSGLPREVYLYPVGLLAGVAAIPVIRFVDQTEKERQRRTAGGFEEVKESIVQHIRGKNFRMISFGRLREDLGKPEWEDAFIRDVIARYPTQLRNAVLKGGKPGVALMVQEDEG
jgi:hypothetical protein